MGRFRGKYLLYALVIIGVSICLIRSTVKEGFEEEEDTFYVPPFIKHSKGDEHRIVSGVPLVIYQSWYTNKVPAKMKENIYRLIERNPEFDYKLYSDEASFKFIKANFSADVANAFNTLKPGAYKSDLWRYCILYKNGGVYLDIKCFSVKPLLPIIEENPVIFVRDLPRACNEHIGIWNGFMATPPNNTIMKACIDDIVNSCKMKLYKFNSLSITGPCLLGSFIRDKISFDYINSLKFKFVWFGPPQHNMEIQYDGETIIKSYPEYRAEQSKFQKGEHYSTAWYNKNVYA
jgi:hypothetical protein